ncbi:hypothetical protein [Streptomyces sp. NPDC003996]
MATIDTGALAGGLAERLLTIELQLIPDPKCREEADLDRAPQEADSPGSSEDAPAFRPGRNWTPAEQGRVSRIAVRAIRRPSRTAVMAPAMI